MIDPACSALLTSLRERGRPPIETMTPTEARAGGHSLIAMFGPGPDMARTQDFDIRVRDGQTILARLLVPVDPPVGIIAYAHGGGFVIGHIDEFENLGRQLAEKTRCAVLMINYRKAPEHPFPTPLHDVQDTLQWLADNKEREIGPDLPVVLTGDSAGANLMLVSAMHARSNGPAISMVALMYPVLDAAMDTESYSNPENQTLLTKDGMAWFWNHYLPDDDARSDPDASPLRSSSFADLPVTAVYTAEYDVLRDEGLALATALQTQGVTTIARDYAGQVHGFFSMVNILPGSAVAIADMSSDISATLSDLLKTQ